MNRSIFTGRSAVVASYFILVGSILPSRADSEIFSYRRETEVVQIDTKSTGQIVKWSVDGKDMVEAGAPSSPLFLTLADGARQQFVANSFHESKQDKVETVSIAGHLGSFPVTLSYDISEEGRKIAVRIDAEKRPDSLINSYRWSLPLSLAPRKRVFFLGDYGLEWDDRYFYQLFLDPLSHAGNEWSFLPQPDRSEWRYFALDQLSRTSFRLWKSESAQTAPLTVQEGRRAAPAVQIHDEHGGVLVEYPSLQQDAPKSLRVDAAGGGMAEVEFWPRFCDPTPASRPGIWGHQEIFLTAYGSDAAALAGRTELKQKYQPSFSIPLRPEDAMLEPKWLRTTPANPVEPHYVTSGYPFAVGELHDVKKIHVAVAGTEIFAQASPLAYWPDGSIKWALLTFPLPAKEAVVDCPPPRVSLRSGQFFPVKISIGDDAQPPPNKVLSVVKNKDGTVLVSNGNLLVILSTGNNWLQSIKWNGRPLLDSSKGPASAYCEYLNDPKSAFPFDLRPKGGTADFGTLKVDSLSIEESGPLRGVVKLEGLTTNAEPTRIILRLEFLADRPEIRLTHTAIFRFADPRRTFLTGMGIEMPLSSTLTAQARVEDHTFSRPQNDRLTLLQASIKDEILISGNKAAPVEQTTEDAHGWMQVSGVTGGVTAMIRNFEQMAPKALSAHLNDGKLRFELWPEGVSAMDVRRYSDYVHRAKLESGRSYDDVGWFRDIYYAASPFYGISRTHEMLISFQQNEKASPESEAADFQSPALLYAGWDRYNTTQVAMPSSAQTAWPRAWDAWTRLTQFFLYHRDLYNWYGFWNFGDFQHRYQGGFGWIVPPENVEAKTPGNLMAVRQMDNRPLNDWNSDSGASGWTNTEGMPGLFLQTEYLRHGNRAVYFAAEAMARYARDVIIRQEGPWLGTGTRHGVQPWSDGDHEERQTNPGEYGLHYLLSGDGRSRDVIDNLYENVYTKGKVDRNASHSGRLSGLLFHWELTGAADEADRLKRYTHLFVSDKGIITQPTVLFPEATGAGKPALLNDGNKFFHTFGAMHSLLEYQRLTNDPEIADAVIKMADAVIKKPGIEKKLGDSDFSWAPVAFAALHAPNPQPYQDFLKHYIEGEGWKNAYQPVTKNPDHWTGPSGLFIGSPVALAFFWGNWAPYVTDALPGGEVWTPDIERQFNDGEKKGRTSKAAVPSWQSQFDGIPEINSYLGSQQPWQQKK